MSAAHWRGKIGGWFNRCCDEGVYSLNGKRRDYV